VSFNYPPNVVDYLTRLLKLIEERFDQAPSDRDIDYYIRPRTYIVLPSFFYWFPDPERFAPANLELLTKSFRKEGVSVFPVLGATGTGSLEEIALGGVVGLNVSFRLFLIVSAPPAEDIVQRSLLTLSHIANIILGSFREIPFWWFTRVREIETLPRPDIQSYTISMLSGEISGLGHPIAPFPPEET